MSNKYKKYASVMSLILTLTMVSTVFGNGCQGPGDAFGVNSNANSQSASDPEFEAIPGERTASTVYANQVLSSMVSCIGIGSESVQTRQEWEDRRGTFSEAGFATSLTAPMLMGVTAIAGEVCNDLLVIEEALPANQRNIFPSFDFTSGPGTLTEADLVDATIRMSLSCWQRNLDSIEEGIVIDYVSQSIIGVEETGAETRNAALTLCTGILSALSSIEM